MEDKKKAEIRWYY